MMYKVKLFCIVSFLGLSACTTITDKIPTVKIERKKPKVIKTVQANYTAPKVHKAEAAMVCENDNMRARSVDKNHKNDTARVLILEEGGRSSNIIADVEVNCRDYFQTAHSSTAPTLMPTTAPQIIPSNAPQTVYVTQQSVPAATHTPPQSQKAAQTVSVPKSAPQPKVIKASSNVQAADGYYYSIKKGDTLYRIARENCSSVMDISALNGIYDPTKIEIHQIIRLPAQKCNARK